MKSSSRSEILNYLITPEVYDELYREEQYLKYKCLLEVVGNISGFILDAGCGTGLLYEYLSEHGFSRKLKYICMDPSIEMLLKAKTRIKSPLIILLESYAEEIPLRNSMFDYVFSISTWGVIGEKIKAIREFKRVAKHGGVVVITGYPKTFTVKPTEINEDYVELLQCIDYFYVARLRKENV